MIKEGKCLRVTLTDTSQFHFWSCSHRNRNMSVRKRRMRLLVCLHTKNEGSLKKWMNERNNKSRNWTKRQQRRSKGPELLISMPVDSFDSLSPCLPPSPLSSPLSLLCAFFASWLWTEMGFRARLSFEVLWLSAKRSAVPAAICEGAASSHLSLHFPSMTERGRSQRHTVHTARPTTHEGAHGCV